MGIVLSLELAYLVALIPSLICLIVVEQFQLVHIGEIK